MEQGLSSKIFYTGDTVRVVDSSKLPSNYNQFIDMVGKIEGVCNDCNTRLYKVRFLLGKFGNFYTSELELFRSLLEL